MIPTAHHPAIFVRLALTKLLITEARFVSTSNGINANGNAKLSTTCDRIKIFKGSSPIAITTIAGIIVISRRKKMENLISRNPSMIT